MLIFYGNNRHYVELKMIFGASVIAKCVSDVNDFMGNYMSSFNNMKFRKKGLGFEDFSDNGSSMSLLELIFCLNAMQGSCLAVWKLFEYERKWEKILFLEDCSAELWQLDFHYP